MAFLDYSGLSHFLDKIKVLFPVKADAIKNITRSGTTFTATRADNTTFTFDQQDSNTKNTAGTTNKTGTKMFIAAATEQSANPQTYSNSNVYIGTDNCLYSGGTKVLTSHQDISGKVDKNSNAYLASVELSPGSSTAGHGGFIDFHYNGSSADNTSRIIEDSSGHIKINSCGFSSSELACPNLTAANSGNQLSYIRALYGNVEKAKLYADAEGGNLILFNPAGKELQIDGAPGHLWRYYTWDDNGNYQDFSYNRNSATLAAPNITGASNVFSPNYNLEDIGARVVALESHDKFDGWTDLGDLAVNGSHTFNASKDGICVITMFPSTSTAAYAYYTMNNVDIRASSENGTAQSITIPARRGGTLTCTHKFNCSCMIWVMYIG